MEAFGKIIGSFKDMGKSGLETLEHNPLGSITSLFGMIDQFSKAQKEKAMMDRSIYYAKHPEAISNMVTKATKPLEAGLVKGTENIVNASLAEQGLSQAPGIQSQVLTQALAPYQQNAQQMAMYEVFKALGMPQEALAGIKSTMRPDDLAAMLKNILPGSGGSPAATSGGGQQTTPSILPDWIPGSGDEFGAVGLGAREG